MLRSELRPGSVLLLLHDEGDVYLALAARAPGGWIVLIVEQDGQLRFCPTWAIAVPEGKIQECWRVFR